MADPVPRDRKAANPTPVIGADRSRTTYAMSARNVST